MAIFFLIFLCNHELIWKPKRPFEEDIELDGEKGEERGELTIWWWCQRRHLRVVVVVRNGVVVAVVEMMRIRKEEEDMGAVE